MRLRRSGIVSGEKSFPDPDDAALPSAVSGLHSDNPASLLERCFGERRDRPAVNPLLTCRAVGFSHYRGDWLGVLITPWFVDLYLLPGGGSLWGDIPAGQRRYVELPQGTVPFTAADDPKIGPYQYSPLMAPVSTLPDMAAAMKLAHEVMRGISGEVSSPAMATGTAEERLMKSANPEINSRRGFFRRLAGKR